MKITEDMINPELRVQAKLNKALNAYSSITTIKAANAFMHRFMIGKSFTSKCSYRQEYIDRPDGSKLRICIYTPFSYDIKEVGLLWIHGGGYSSGIPEHDIVFFEKFVVNDNCIVVSPDYTLSVEAPYPAAINDCYLTLIWMRDNAKKLGIDPNWITVGGDSAGGGLAAAVTLMARDKKEVDVKYQMLLYPMLDYRPTESNMDNNAPGWDTVHNLAAWDMYLGDTDNVSKYASPALETDYSNLPETLTYIGTIEPFRDETITYVKNLRKAGTKVAFKQFAGCFHAFDVIGFNTNIGKAAHKFLANGFSEAVKKIKEKY